MRPSMPGAGFHSASKNSRSAPLAGSMNWCSASSAISSASDFHSELSEHTSQPASAASKKCMCGFDCSGRVAGTPVSKPGPARFMCLENQPVQLVRLALAHRARLTHAPRR